MRSVCQDSGARQSETLTTNCADGRWDLAASDSVCNVVDHAYILKNGREGADPRFVTLGYIVEFEYAKMRVSDSLWRN